MNPIFDNVQVEHVTMKCHWCHKELEETYLEKTLPDGEDHLFLECPEAHCIIGVIPETKEIVSYSLWMDRDDKRFFIKGDKRAKTTSFNVKTSFDVKTQHRRFINILTIPRFLALKPNKETQILEGRGILSKLKTLTLFS